MGIVFYENGIGFGLGAGKFNHATSEDGWLSVWAENDERPYVMVMSQRGLYIEIADEAGNKIGEFGDGAYHHIDISKRVMMRRIDLPDPKLSPEELDAERRSVTRTLVEDAPYSIDGFPGGLRDMISWLGERLEEIPEDCRDSASVEFDTTMEYGETYPNFRIEYEQPETDDEVIYRVKVQRKRDEQADMAERAEFERLKAKLENT